MTTFVMMAGAAATISAAPPGNAANGAVIFKKCVSCHSVDPSGKNGLGPNLRGVAGRKAGTVAAFTYSPALKASGLVWNDQTLARFLAAPRQTVPGTRMIFIGLPKPEDQADVIAYLKQHSAKK
ncbi:cytochrome c family protein [Sphingomonas sp. QA11]|uniref:c-type cytochrome n=1 Tax=Sphingomonas sp. QA11 TaxID=2950605 RepID=UPI002349644B|nr:cytochrome c family protein [Sphingomonas sp. QA11]WCM26636.1 cytochrome c family protein [Sphingomonas sp. QA11]